MKGRSILIAFLISVVIAISFVPTADQVEAKETPYHPTPYSAIYDILQTYEKESHRVTVEVIGQSALGHDLYGVVISDPQAKGKYGKYQALRKRCLSIQEVREIGWTSIPTLKCPS